MRPKWEDSRLKVNLGLAHHLELVQVSVQPIIRDLADMLGISRVDLCHEIQFVGMAVYNINYQRRDNSSAGKSISVVGQIDLCADTRSDAIAGDVFDGQVGGFNHSSFLGVLLDGGRDKEAKNYDENDNYAKNNHGNDGRPSPGRFGAALVASWPETPTRKLGLG
ncbi:hypothetical protein HG531_006157 [Fusarium graminearum]|nr:hypothetical protein HG531_006157 [Fusarium graminearum]